MNHSFNVEIATRLKSVEKAILIENLAFWLKKNSSNNRHYYDGSYWSYNSSQSFSELFPYMNPKSISRWLRELEQAGIIKSGNYNKKKYDRTKWYSIIDDDINKEYSMTHNEQRDTQNEQPIPDINTDINISNNTETSISEEVLDIVIPTNTSIDDYLEALSNWWNGHLVDDDEIGQYSRIHRSLFPDDKYNDCLGKVSSLVREIGMNVKAGKREPIKYPYRYLKKCLS